MRAPQTTIKTAASLMLLCIGMLGQHAACAQAATDPEAAFEKAMKARAAGELQESIEAFQSVLGIEPSLHRARLELASAYFQALNYAEARQQAQRVLDDPNTPEVVKVNIRRFLEQIAASDIRHTFTPYVHLGALYNSNVNAGPGSDLFQDIVLAPGSVKTDDHAVTLYAGLSHRYLAPTGVKVGGKNASFTWNSNASYYRADYAKQDDYDLDVFSLGTGPGFFVAGKWRGGVNLQWDETQLGGDRYATYVGLNPAITGIFGRGRTEVTGEASIQKRSFHRASEDGRDSNYAAVGVSVGQVVGLTAAIQIGARYFEERADFSYFSNHGYEAYVGVNWQATKPLSLYGRASYRDSQYDAAEPLLAAARDENTGTLTLGATYKFMGSLLDQWEMIFNYIYTDNRSNIGLYAFDREQVSVTLGRSF
jgi:tetratricopeptide (TPR) repeat protein